MANKKKNSRCPLQDTCERNCEFENRERECRFYRDNCIPGDEIEGQPVLVGGALTIDDEINAMQEKERAAMDLDARIKVHANLAWQNLMESAKCLKEMRDTGLYKELGYTSFESYTQHSLGIKQRQAYTYIKAYEDLGERFLHSNANLGITKLGLLSEIPATERDDFVENNDLASMSVEEVKKLVAENDAKGEQIDMLTEECENLKTAHDEADNERNELKADLEFAENKISRLEAELEEARNKPTEVAVAEPDEETLNKVRDEAAKSAKAEAEKQFKADKKALKDKLTAEKDKAISEATEKAQKDLDDYKARVAVLDEEKANLLKRSEELEKQLAISASPETVMFTFYFEALQNDYKKLFESIATIRKSNPEVADKYKSALLKYYTMLEEQIRGL